MRSRCSHVIAGIVYCARVEPPYHARCVVCVSTSSLSSFVIDGFDTLPRSMCGLRSHVIAVIACSCPVSGPVTTTIAVRNARTNCPRIWPAIARNVWSVLARHRYRRLSLTSLKPCRDRCVVLVRTPSAIACYCPVSSPVATTLEPTCMYVNPVTKTATNKNVTKTFKKSKLLVLLSRHHIFIPQASSE